MPSRVLCAVVAVLATACASPAAEKELHVVALYEGHQAVRERGKPGTAAVTVDRPGKDVVLVVQGYDRIDWEVRATAKTNLTKVLAVGYHRQTVIAPNGIKIEERTHDGKADGVCNTYITGHYDIEGPRFRSFVRKLTDLIETDLSSFQGASRFDPKKPFVVDAVQKDERLSADFPQLAPAAQRPKLKIEATRLVFRDLGDVRAGLGEFTQTGPTADGFVSLPKRMRQVTYDAKAKQHYGINDHNLFVIDLTTGGATKIERPQDFSWSQALTHDAKRGRVLVATRGGLFEYETKGEGKWALLAKERGSFYSALVWQSKTDTVFAFAVDRDPKNSARRVPTLFELKADGSVANKTMLGSPLFPGILGEYGHDGYAELIDLGAELALLVHSENRDSGTGERGKPEAFLYVIDPKTGKVKLAWKE